MLSTYSSSVLVAASIFALATTIRWCQCESQLLNCTNSTLEVQYPCSQKDLQNNPESSQRRTWKKIRSERNADVNVVCSGTQQDNASSSSSYQKTTSSSSLVCTPLFPEQTTEDEERSLINVFIRTPNNATQFEPGSALTIECRFTTTTLEQDLRFNLRWLRSVTASEGSNQSIAATDTGDSTLNIIAATTRVWTVQKNGGLDLELNDFQAGDVGKYFCQALTLDTNTILSEARVQLKLINTQRDHIVGGLDNSNGLGSSHLVEIINKNQQAGDRKNSFHDVQTNSSTIESGNFYSPDSLAKLLPPLKVIPNFSELELGDQIQLACVTDDVASPDPEPSAIEWTFDWMPDRRTQLMFKAPISSDSLPGDISVLGNILMIWSMSHVHCGIYTCHYRMKDFNLTAEAAGELTLRVQKDSPPLVYTSPELIRLKPNSSARVQCEATGYPPPKIVWFRTEATPQVQSGSNSLQVSSDKVPAPDVQRQLLELSLSDEMFGVGGIELEQINYRDTVVYCQHTDCASSKTNSTDQITAISLVHLNRVRAHHQGQYVCQATNKYGSSEASALVDVEYREPPIISIDPKFRTQTIELKQLKSTTNSEEQSQNVTFKCHVEAGRPKPKLSWLRTKSERTFNNPGGGRRLLKFPNSKNRHDDFDIYDLTRVSSATSKVSTWLENNGKTLSLVISTISLDDEGEYVCLGENDWGRHSAVARLYVRRPVSLKISQSSPYVAQVNNSFQLECLVTGYPLPIDIEWSRSDKGLVFFSPVSRSLSNIQESQERAVLKFDRINLEDSGEYTCNARNPLDPGEILRDTIMVMVGDQNEQEEQQRAKAAGNNQNFIKYQTNSLVPKLVIKPAKVNARVGDNITLDCLTVSGLQPTIVEWLAPSMTDQQVTVFTTTLPTTTTTNQNADLAMAESSNSMTNFDVAFIRPYYHNTIRTLLDDRLYQFGSKLKITNITKSHEGVYQCKARNRLGIENAPAFIRVMNAADDDHQTVVKNGGDSENNESQSENKEEFKTKIAKLGLNIELKCQVNGVDQPATSWSRDGQELPKTSVQIENNLWIQNVSTHDNGLYICSARSKRPNKVIQAKIKLLVDEDSTLASGDNFNLVKNLTAKIVASKSVVNVGDSITLECIISQLHSQEGSSNAHGSQLQKGNDQLIAQKNVSTLSSIVSNERATVDLDEIERNVIWTNLHSGQTLFQDNVYIQENLLIIYGLKWENSATYRCNYNELTQHVDYKLDVKIGNLDLFEGNDHLITTNVSTNIQGDSSQITFNDGSRVELKQAPVGGYLIVDCAALTKHPLQESFYWIKGNDLQQYSQRIDNPLQFDPIKTRDADIYHCHLDLAKQLKTTTDFNVSSNNGSIISVIIQVTVPTARFLQKPVSFVTLPTISGANHQLDVEMKFLPENENGLILFNGQQQQLSSSALSSNRSSFSASTGDFISLTMSRGFLEFRFELGDGTTLLRSSQPLTLNQWHKVVIERNRRGAVMWLDKQPPVSNSSVGKFFNLNLDSVLYIGGIPLFLQNKSSTSKPSAPMTRSYGYRRGFQGCISLLRISQQEINLMSRNRSVSVGVFECDKSECRGTGCFNNGLCQVDRDLEAAPKAGDKMAPTELDSTRRASIGADLRCICAPGLTGRHCTEKVLNTSQTNLNSPKNQNQSTNSTTIIASTSTTPPTTTKNKACELLMNPCSSNGTIECQSFTSTSFKCHCKVGFAGETCSRATKFTSVTSVAFDEAGYLQFRFNKPEEAEAILSNGREKHLDGTFKEELSKNVFNSTNYQKSSVMTEHQEISFNLRTRSSYGLIFYTGQLPSTKHQTNDDGHNSGSSSSSLSKMHLNQTSGGTINGPPAIQASKSMIVNLLASRLSNAASSSIMPDYLAIALVDGHIELSYELGSGVAIIRSSQRFNDDEKHQINVIRHGKSSKLTIDSAHIFEGHSPGKLSMLNSHPDANFLGGLPFYQSNSIVSSPTSSSTYKSNLGFVGCLSDLEINTFGPFNLIESSHLIQIISARNLIPCGSSSKPAVITQPTPLTPTSTHRTYLQSSSPSVESDDPDEM